MIYVLLNALPILAATLAGLAVGAAHRALLARSAAPPGPARPGFLLLAFVAEFWLASILAGALILAPPEAPPRVMALASAGVIWAGFVLPTLAVTMAHRGLPARAIAADAAHWLAVMLAQAAVLHALGLVRPPG